MNPFFFQKFWDSIGDDVSTVVLSILDGHPIPSKLNHTYVALIPKKPKPENIFDFCPISLCHVIYKLIMKVIANRLKPLLPSIISNTQGAFTQGRLISNNVLIACKVLHAMRGDMTVDGSMAVKLDMSKAFDRVEWPFLKSVILRLGFREDWVNLVMRCVKSASFSFIINGHPSEHIIHSRDILQGGPLSPFLFLFCSEGLTRLIADAVDSRSVRGYNINARAPVVSHLLFTATLLYSVVPTYLKPPLLGTSCARTRMLRDKQSISQKLTYLLVKELLQNEETKSRSF